MPREPSAGSRASRQRGEMGGAGGAAGPVGRQDERKSPERSVPMGSPAAPVPETNQNGDAARGSSGVPGCRSV